MAFVSLPEMSCWGNSYAQRVCPSPVCLRLIQRHFPPKSRFLGVANAMIEAKPGLDHCIGHFRPLRIIG
jgi:hypothetical protein